MLEKYVTWKVDDTVMSMLAKAMFSFKMNETTLELKHSKAVKRRTC